MKTISRIKKIKERLENRVDPDVIEGKRKADTELAIWEAQLQTELVTRNDLPEDYEENQRKSLLQRHLGKAQQYAEEIRTARQGALNRANQQKRVNQIALLNQKSSKQLLVAIAQVLNLDPEKI